MKSIFVTIIASFAVVTQGFADPLTGVPESVVKRHLETTGDECNKNQTSGPSIYDLGQGIKLYLIPCLYAANQNSSRGYLTKNNDQDISQVVVLNYDELTGRIAGTLDLSDAGFDPATNTLSTAAFGSNLHDCGQLSWSKVIVDKAGGVSVKTVEIRRKAKCDGKEGPWPVIYKQK